MHVVAAKPLYLRPEDVPAELVAKEKELLASQMEDTGKPPEVVDKIVEARLRKFYEGICLTEQAHMIEEKNPKVSAFLKQQGIEVKRFEAFFIS
jgi:elongation factor Ts